MSNPTRFSPLPETTCLVLDSFAKFSRFKCAPKRAGSVKKGAGGSASAAWNEFADTLNGKLATITDADFISAKSFLLLVPPQKQMFVVPTIGKAKRKQAGGYPATF